MSKVQSNWDEVKDELNAKLKQWQGSCGDLESAANISYWSARWALNHEIQNRTEAAEALCILFGIELFDEDKSAKVQSRSLASLEKILAETWDGSEPHAELLANLIKSTKAFKVEERS